MVHGHPRRMIAKAGPSDVGVLCVLGIDVAPFVISCDGRCGGMFQVPPGGQFRRLPFLPNVWLPFVRCMAGLVSALTDARRGPCELVRALWFSPCEERGVVRPCWLLCGFCIADFSSCGGLCQGPPGGPIRGLPCRPFALLPSWRCELVATLADVHRSPGSEGAPWSSP